MFFGHDGINESDTIKVRDDKIFFQSHIAGDWNDNVWNEENYKNIKNVLDYLSESSKLNYCTLGEL